jgi:hypothetical protein
MLVISFKTLKTQHITEHSMGLLTEGQHQEPSKPNLSTKYICFDAEFENTAKPIQSKRDLNLQTLLIPKNSLYKNNMEGDVINRFLHRRFT